MLYSASLCRIIDCLYHTVSIFCKHKLVLLRSVSVERINLLLLSKVCVQCTVHTRPSVRLPVHPVPPIFSKWESRLKTVNFISSNCRYIGLLFIYLTSSKCAADAQSLAACSEHGKSLNLLRSLTFGIQRVCRAGAL